MHIYIIIGLFIAILNLRDIDKHNGMIDDVKFDTLPIGVKIFYIFTIVLFWLPFVLYNIFQKKFGKGDNND